MFYVELVWNREFHFVPYVNGSSDIDSAIKLAQRAENLGGGEAVKKTRVVDSDGKVVWAYGKSVA